MALAIKEHLGTHFLEGRLNTTTAEDFLKHFEHVISIRGRATINIENLSEIDKTGLSALKRLIINNARYFNKNVCVVGVGCKEIYDDFKSSIAA
ncbi:hypothetical protein [Pontimicrobium sp. SW4]|uniref:STAS domain-containing protein n=1 Tax=Pontimicrobium sp. SW4 TaxID=3153519 RepID=A0AAU7BU51_9FLAO